MDASKSTGEAFSCESVAINIADLRSLHLLLKSPEPHVLTAVCEKLTSVAEMGTKQRVQLMHMGLLPTLIELTTNTDADVRKKVAACLAATTEVAELTDEMRRPELIQALLKLIVIEEPIEVQEESLFALANLLADLSNNADFRKNSGTKALIRMLQSTDADVQKNAALAASIFVTDYSAKAEIRIQKGLAPLIELLGSEHPEIVESVLLSLLHCAEEHNNRLEIRQLQGIKKIVGLLEQQETQLDVQVQAMNTLTQCMEEQETTALVNELNGIKYLARNLASEDARVQKSAALAIASAAKLEANHFSIREFNVIPSLLGLLQGHDSAVISASAVTLTELCKHEQNQSEVARLNGIEMLLKQVNHGDLEVKRRCLQAICQLATNSKWRSKIKTAEGVKLLLHFLAIDDATLQMNGAETIYHLADDVNHRTEIAKCNGIEIMIRLLHSRDFGVQRASAMALSRILLDHEHRITFQNLKGLEVAIGLLKSKDPDVCRSAAWLLSSAALSDAMSSSACSMDVFEPLIELSRGTVTSTVKFANDALEKLLKQNLSAKYWMRSHLGPENMISSRFYDLGPCGNKETSGASVFRFPTLAQLQAMPVDKKRECLLVDFISDTNLIGLLKAAVDTCFLPPPTPPVQVSVAETTIPATNTSTGKSEKEAKLEKEKNASSTVPDASNSTGAGGQAAPNTPAGPLIATREMINSLQPKGTLLERLQQLALIVSHAMGGPVDRTRLSEYGYAFRLAELKLNFNSNVLPLGAISQGMYYHRALLFKVLADHIGIPTALTRGEYQRAWNTVQVKSEGLDQLLLVDVMHRPGSLLPIQSPEAMAYQHLV